MKKITVPQIMKWNPCIHYTFFKVCKLIKFGKTPLEILDLDIHIDDRFWVVLREEIIPERALHLLACDFAQSVAHLNPDPRIQKTIDAKRKWVDGRISTEELRAARHSLLNSAHGCTQAMDAAKDAALNSSGRFSAFTALTAARNAMWCEHAKGSLDVTRYARYDTMILGMVRKVLKEIA